ncbi:MAG: 16S rRNA (cytidine(1402)-2'-O)-methyltransferase [Bacilli bacterium]|nr:16S rRNA (cytidine(1402)-2'-O)-methyltransferase [Bacilli bacterium]
MSQLSYYGQACLYLIPTPIGNLEDITIRALNLLKSVDLILCEDTRVTGNLLKKYSIKNKLMSCHEHNEEKIKQKVVEYLQEGKNIGLVTDQGSPIISDPGYVIAKKVIEEGLAVVGLPGATAFVPALISSGLAPSPFLFYGFLNSKDSKQIKELEKLKNLDYSLVFYEAPHRIEKTLKNMIKTFGDRRISLAREISKLYEEIFRGNISEVLEQLAEIKGEIVLVVEGNKMIEDYSHITIEEHIRLYLDDGVEEKEAMKKVAKDRHIAKTEVYKEYKIGGNRK